MPYKEHEIERVYWPIRDVAGMIHQPTSTVRFWEGEFDWFKPKKNKIGYRQYNRTDIEVVMGINIMVTLGGHTIKGVRDAYNLGYLDELKMLYIEKHRNQSPRWEHISYPMRPEDCFEKNTTLA